MQSKKKRSVCNKIKLGVASFSHITWSTVTTIIGNTELVDLTITTMPSPPSGFNQNYPTQQIIVTDNAFIYCERRDQGFMNFWPLLQTEVKKSFVTDRSITPGYRQLQVVWYVSISDSASDGWCVLITLFSINRDYPGMGMVGIYERICILDMKCFHCTVHY